MTPSRRDSPADRPRDAAQTAADEIPGVPGFRSWSRVYWFVFGCFVAFVVVLTIFSRFYA